jgi:hypothetical protein
VVVARLVLTATDSEGDTLRTQTEELDGVLLFARPSALLPSASDSVLLYWPGHFGGLQRFASCQALQQKMFKRRQRRHASAAPFAADRQPVRLALQIQLHNEQQATRLMTAQPAPSHADQRTAELEQLREQTLARLTVPASSARSWPLPTSLSKTAARCWPLGCRRPSAR